MKKVIIELTENEAKSLKNVLRYENETLVEFVHGYEDDTFESELNAVQVTLLQLEEECGVS